MPAQEPVRQPVKGADPKLPGGRVKQRFNAGAHLVGRLVGEGDRKQVPWRGALRAYQPGGAMHQHARLAAAGAGQYQHRLLSRRHGLPLGGIQRLENMGYIHWA